MADENPLSCQGEELPLATRAVSASAGEARPGTTTEAIPASRTEQAAEEEPQPANGGNDAVCFTAGFVGATFGAGTIHAYLAADREPPLVVAGISMGALTAAAMQRSYRELKEARLRASSQLEMARWRWFRQYLLYLTDKPFSVIWNGLPKQSDFFADLIPVKDPTVDEYKTAQEEKGTKRDWEHEELVARRELYLFVKLGNWLATLPVTVSRLASLLVTHIRLKEKHQDWRWLRPIKYAYLWARLLFSMIRHICFSPRLFPEYKFPTKWYEAFPVRPLLGWPVYLVAWVLFATCLFLVGAAAQVVGWLLTRVHVPYLTDYLPDLLRTAPLLVRWLSKGWAGGYAGLALAFHSVQQAVRFLFGAAVTGLILLLLYRQVKNTRLLRSMSNKLFQHLLRNLELEQALVYDFHLRLRLTRLFGTDGVSPLLADDPMPILLVAAPLQRIEDQDGPVVAAQVWAKPDTPLVDALYAAIAQPGLFRPLHLENGAQITQWMSGKQIPPRKLDLVDGNVVRQNPIPALFTFLKDERPALLTKLKSRRDDPRIHVVYNVPLHGQASKKTYGPLGMNIVDVVRISLQLNRRRDTSLEVQQTNFLSQLEEEVRNRGPASDRVHPIFADEIAPEEEIAFGNRLDPQPEETLAKVADGCRRTLEILYRNELKTFPGVGDCVYCPRLLADVAKNRKWLGHPNAPPGLPEVCSRCTQLLARPREQQRRPLPSSLATDFPMLTGAEPRVVFVASGGVFRGPFHGGMLACLLAAQIRPQMIVGASVGTLMGGALGAMLSAKDYSEAIHHLGDMVDIFLHLDHKIAFTKTLKDAAREIGIRARSIQLSPNKIRRIIRAGGRSDPGYALTGAPAALIDAFSDLLMIPHQRTRDIAAEFVAGHVPAATKMLLEQMKSETLGRLDIEYAVLGTSLLKPTAQKLLGGCLNMDLKTAQPYQKHGMAFFGTTTDLVSEEPRLLGRYDVPGGAGTYDFVEAGLASSAFPGVFSPRRESEVFPGAGRTDVLLSDGGMFDNLPFIPAIEMLGDVQRAYRQEERLDSVDFLRRRHEAPDLFIAGSLNVRPETDKDAEGPFDDLITIARRAGSLQDNVKIRAFQGAAELISGQLDRLFQVPPKGGSVSDQDFIDAIVDATVLPVFPVDRDHLNPTFAFCASTGLKRERVQKSIADGCFQTFAAFAEAQRTPPLNKDLVLAGRSVAKLRQLGRVPQILWAGESGGKISGEGRCPFFRHSTDAEKSQESKRLVEKDTLDFVCPFYATANPSGRAIYAACAGDPTHKDEASYHPPPKTRMEKAAVAFYSLARRI